MYTQNVGTELAMASLERLVTQDPDRPTYGIEIGCFEGRTTERIISWFTHPDSKIICLDPFLDRCATAVQLWLVVCLPVEPQPFS